MQLRFAALCHLGTARRAGSPSRFDGSSETAMFRAVEAAGFDRLILDSSVSSLEGRTLAAAALDATESLGVVLPHRISVNSPVTFARQVCALATRGNGRLSLQIHAGPSEGTDLGHEAALRRADEYLMLLNQLWLNERPIDHEGPFFSLHRAFVGNKAADGMLPQFRLDGVSGTALKVAGRHADILHLPPGPSDQTLSLIGRAREAAAMRGRSQKLGFAIPVDVSGLLGPGEQEAADPSRRPRLDSEVQRLAGILTCYRDMEIGEFIVTGLRDRQAIETFGAKALPLLRSILQKEEASAPVAPRGSGIALPV